MFWFNIVMTTIALSSCASEVETEMNQPENFESSEAIQSEQVIEQIQFSIDSIQKDPNLEGIDFKGAVESSYWWEDENGGNYLINTIARSTVDGLPAAHLYSYHYIQKPDKSLELMRLVQDYEDVCDFDITLEFLGNPSITDLNEDNVAEVAIAYRKSCRSDVSECEMKVIMHDQNGKYGLRGFQYIVFPNDNMPVDYEFDLTKIPSSDDTPEWLDFRGRYKNTNDFSGAPGSFLKLADSIWQANAFERFD